MRMILAAALVTASTINQAQEVPVSPETQEGYVCSVFLRDIGLPEKALVFAVTSEPDCQGEWEWQHNYACPISGGRSTNGHACSKTEYSAAELQMLHDQLMTASRRRTRVYAVQGQCQSAEATNTCFVELGYMNRPYSRAQSSRAASQAISRRSATSTGFDGRKEP